MKHLLIFIMLSTSIITVNAQLNPVNQDSFKLLLNEYLTEFNAPGVIASVFSATEVLNIDKSGLRNINKSDSMTIDDKIHLGSNSKAMTGFVAGALVEKGLINWETKFFDVLPELKKASKRKYRNITLADLLSHTAYVVEFTEDEEFELLPGLENGNGVIEDRLDFCKYIIKQKPIRKFKQKSFTYSNAGYAMAAAMLERVSGKTWNDLIKEELASPLGIDAGFDWPNMEDETQPWGHYLDEEKNNELTCLSPDNEYHIGSLVAPAGDIHMSMVDYIKYLQANMLGLQGHDNVLKSETYTDLHYKNVDVSIYGLGWGIGNINVEGKDYKLSMHNGSGGTYYCHTMIIPGLNLGLAIMSNAGSDLHEEGVKKLRNGILKLVKNELEKNKVASN